MIVFITTADTDILTVSYALPGLPEGFPQVRATNPAYLTTQEALDDLLDTIGRSGVVVLRLLGGKRALQNGFDPLVRPCATPGASPQRLSWAPGMG